MNDIRRGIIFFHGRDTELEKRVAKVCFYDVKNDEYYFEESLDDFALHFDRFMVLGNKIAVTQHKNFSQRG